MTLPPSDPSADNPFSTRYTRPGAIPFQFPPGVNAERLVEQLKANRWYGAIAGPHGSGKSSLLAALVPAIRRAGKTVLWITLHDGQRRLPVDLRRHPDVTDHCVVIVDGYEQLSWWNRLRTERFCRRRRIGLVVTSHRPVRLPLLFCTSTTLGLAEAIVKSLLTGRPEIVSAEELARRFESHRGNLRELLFDLYNLYEQRRP